MTKRYCTSKYDNVMSQ